MSATRLQENIGKILHDRYTLVAAVGQGTSGDVYLAHDVSLGRKVAIKLLHSSLAGDAFFLKRFHSEAKSAASLNHPSIMRVFDWGESGASPYLVLEYLSGGSLREFLNLGDLLDESQAASLMLQVAQGLSYAHGRGYVHRDIKPANLLFDDEARIRIADFGLARALSEAAWTEPVGTLVGTARYASPEQALAKESDKSSDVYSLALVIYEALLGYLPFTGDTTVALLMSRLHSDVGVPDEAGSLRDILASCLTLSVQDRITSSGLVSQLEKLVRVLDPPAALNVNGPVPVVPNVKSTDLTESALPIAVSSSGGLAGDTTSAFPATSAIAVVPFDVAGDMTAVPSPSVVGSGGGSGSRTAGTRKPFYRRPLLLLGALLLVIALLVGGFFLTGQPSSLYSAIFDTKVPLVVGDNLSSAKASITSAHLKVGSITYAYSSSIGNGLVSAQSAKNGVSLARGSYLNLLISKGVAPVEVPQVVGDSVVFAQNRLRSLGLVPIVSQSYSETAPSGQVMSESPASGLHSVGTKVALTVSQGPAPRSVPNLVGESASVAKQQLRALALVPSESQAFSTTVTSGDVISQSSAPGTMVPRGSGVSFVVSKGPQYVYVPNVVGDSLQQAETIINQAGLTVGTVYSYFGSSTVVATSPGAGAKVRVGSSVAFVTG